jgi:hypothetical protein
MPFPCFIIQLFEREKLANTVASLPILLTHHSVQVAACINSVTELIAAYVKMNSVSQPYC